MEGRSVQETCSLIVEELSRLVEKQQSLLKSAEADVEESLNGFIEDKLTKLWGLVGVYKKCLERFGMKTKSELETFLKKYFRYRDVQEIVTELDDTEKEWDTFLQNIDEIIDDTGEGVVSLGEEGPVNEPLVDVRSEKNVTLRDYLGSSNVLLILLRHFA
ncbi:hypothetical protein ScPMuIL_013957 [Solemya velum]